MLCQDTLAHAVTTMTVNLASMMTLKDAFGVKPLVVDNAKTTQPLLDKLVLLPSTVTLTVTLLEPLAVFVTI